MPRYDDTDFLELLESDGWGPAYIVARRLGCTFRTANRRLIQLAKEGVVEVKDPENDEHGIPDNESTSRPMICYRLVSDESHEQTDPE